jgi:hypothetical protein
MYWLAGCSRCSRRHASVSFDRVFITALYCSLDHVGGDLVVMARSQLGFGGLGIAGLVIAESISIPASRNAGFPALLKQFGG